VEGNTMKWIVGLDLRPFSRGAIQFAAWLAANSTAAGGEELVGVHVLEEGVLLNLLRYQHLDDVLASAQAAARTAVAEVGASDRFETIEILRGAHAESCLEEARVTHQGEALVVGRHAKQEGVSLVRLGRVARKLVRALHAPVVVVPPDLENAALGHGPVMALTDLQSDSTPAAHWAADMAARLGRELRIVHCVSDFAELGAAYLSGARLGEIGSQHREAGARSLSGWLEAEGLPPDCGQVVLGEPVEAALRLAASEHTTLLVAGARRLGLIERFFTARVGFELAAAAPCPVAIVPPPEAHG
jgi:nucleotide-binding universal stress UspA family protein